MRKIITFFSLMLCMFVAAQEATDTMYVYRNDNIIERIPVSKIDSVVFVAPDVTVTPPAVPYSEAVDLGLSVKWAPFNVGATNPEEYGGYYAWGETEERETYYEKDYNIVNLGNEISGTQNDVAHVKWGGNWRMPTLAEQKELVDNCTWEHATVNGVYGYKVTGSNGNSIFLPAAGCRYESEINDVGNAGYYFSGSLTDEYAAIIYFSDDEYMLYIGYSCYGQSVRPVCE